MGFWLYYVERQQWCTLKQNDGIYGYSKAGPVPSKIKLL